MKNPSKPIRLHYPGGERPLSASVQVPGSKSESNRLLLLQGHFPELVIENLSDSDDTRYMLRGMKETGGTVDIHHAGTAMRFLTAYFATTEGREVILTGSRRMTQRPIGILVDALRQLGGRIEYLGEPGYPPLRISGTTPVGNEVEIRADVSSQYISALLLSAPKWPGGLSLKLKGRLTSIPYVEMTLALLRRLDVSASFEGNRIRVEPLRETEGRTLVVESDWSAASYYYSLLSLSPVGSRLDMTAFRSDSLQGDSRLVRIYKDFGVESAFSGHTLTLRKFQDSPRTPLELDLSDAPDIAQTIVVSCLGLGRPCHLKGLHTLPIKETDRLQALKTEIGKLGGVVRTDSESLVLEPAVGDLHSGVSIDTYDDHRMAMAFAPLAYMLPLCIRDPEVVSKSYPGFWNDFGSLGFRMDTVEE